MLVVAVLLTTVLMRVAIIGAVAYLLLPQGSLCPHCGVRWWPSETASSTGCCRRCSDAGVSNAAGTASCGACGAPGPERTPAGQHPAPRPTDQSIVVMRRAARSKKK